MTTIQETLMDIIACQLFGCSIELTGDADWDQILSEAVQQAVFPIVFYYYMNTMQGRDNCQKFGKDYFSRIASNMRNLHYHTELHRMLCEYGISYVILKGQASAYYYPDPTLRTMGDVDFLVLPEQVDAVDALLGSQGFIRSEGAEKHGFHWAYRKEKEVLELHWDVPGIPERENDKLRSYLSDLVSQSREIDTGDGKIVIPSTFHHGLVLLLHTISHLTGSGVGLRHLCDWLVFENSLSDEEFKEIFEKPLREIGLWTFAQVLSQIGVIYFGCAEREWCRKADTSVCSAMLEDVLKGGNFGVKDSTRKSQAKLIQNKKSSKIRKNQLWENGLISLNEKARKEFPFVSRIPLLLPVAWFFTAVQFIVRVIMGKRNNVFEKDIYTDAARRQELYSELKLFEK